MLAAAALCGDCFMPGPVPAIPPGSIVLKVATFNTANDFIASDALINSLRAFEADIVALEELSPRNAAALEGALLEEYPCRVLQGAYLDGRGLLSRHPIAASEFFSIGTGRPQLEAQIDLGGRAIVVYAVHLPAPDYRRLEVHSPRVVPGVRALLERVGQSGLPALVMGDFNTTDQTAAYRMLVGAGLVDTFRKAGRGPGLTYPTRHQYMPVPLPRLFRLDYIFAAPEFIPLLSYTGQGRGSDHLPVFAHLALLPEDAAL